MKDFSNKPRQTASGKPIIEYPQLDLVRLKLPIPESVLEYVKVNGDYLLVDGTVGWDVFQHLRFWVVWPEKQCKQCQASYKLQIQLKAGEDYDTRWSYTEWIPCGAVPVCGCEGKETAKSIQEGLRQAREKDREVKLADVSERWLTLLKEKLDAAPKDDIPF